MLGNAGLMIPAGCREGLECTDPTFQNGTCTAAPDGGPIDAPTD
jgi:hypothetical protein